MLIPLVRNFIPILQSRGYAYQYAEYHEGHSWGMWRAHIDDALEMFFPTEPTSVEPSKSAPDEFQLNQNFPNPFNSETKIVFHLERASDVTMTIYNTMGQKVRTLIEATQPAGDKCVLWDGQDDSGRPVSSGLYLYRLKAKNHIQSKKMIVLR